MARFFTDQDEDYLDRYLRYGHREGFFDSDSEADAPDKLNNEEDLEDYSLR